MRLLLVLSLFVTGCATQTWVVKPQVYDVKKVAIVSVFANQDIRGDQGSHADGGGIAAVGKIIGAQDPVKDGRIRVVAFTADSYMKALQQKMGWKVFSPTKVAASKSYKKFASNGFNQDSTIGKIARAITNVAQANVATLPDMVAVDLNASDFGTRGRQLLQQLCKDLKMDAVALIQLSLSLDESVLNLVVTRSGKAEVRTRIDLFTKNGDYAVHTPEIKNMKPFTSEKSQWSVNGTLKMSEEVEANFQDAITKSVNDVTDRLARELAQK